MILSDIRDYLRVQRRVALSDLVLHFNLDAEALRGMLGKWMTKGKVVKLTKETDCGTSCCKCDPALTEIYEWQE